MDCCRHCCRRSMRAAARLGSYVLGGRAEPARALWRQQPGKAAHGQRWQRRRANSGGGGGAHAAAAAAASALAHLEEKMPRDDGTAKTRASAAAATGAQMQADGGAAGLRGAGRGWERAGEVSAAAGVKGAAAGWEGGVPGARSPRALVRPRPGPRAAGMQAEAHGHRSQWRGGPAARRGRLSVKGPPGWVGCPCHLIPLSWRAQHPACPNARPIAAAAGVCSPRWRRRRRGGAQPRVRAPDVR